MNEMVRMVAAGGVEVLDVANGPALVAGPGEICLRQEAIGVNFIDIYQRRGLYRLPLPAVLGVEGAGVVESVGEGVTHIAPGHRVAYAGALGGYATRRKLPAWRAILLPEEIGSRVAAASMLKGLTAHMLLTRTYPVGAGTVILVHAAAGGLGVMLVRWAKHLGATVIGTVGSREKAELAKAQGADHVIVGRNADLVAEVAAITDDKGVDFAVDGLGGAILAKTLGCVRPFGTVASIGQAAGPIPPVAVEDLGPVRCLSLARPSVMAYAADQGAYPQAADALLQAMQQGVVAQIGAEYALGQAAEAQAALEAGRTTGSLLLVP
ncbi:NADPH2:quinone reductase [Rhodopseudomonas julia]|uniref:NADPH2:quinone reductase n=1 Tax=Rhodopseudomonas julia TaxID=200617 RepID=A0ABU0C4N2_9BRAD|nr:quinone oxidoreductase [Rhodopseudomonas julia]MDQ0325459.1 NADPH2:quinone reductase [Rhodopseudomonas julia]